MWAGVGRVWRVCGAVVAGRLERRELPSDSVRVRASYAIWLGTTLEPKLLRPTIVRSMLGVVAAQLALAAATAAVGVRPPIGLLLDFLAKPDGVDRQGTGSSQNYPLPPPPPSPTPPHAAAAAAAAAATAAATQPHGSRCMRRRSPQC